MGDIVRVVKRGKFVGWYIRYRDADGRRKQRASHQPTKELARRYLLEVEGRVARGVVGIPEPAPPSPTLAALSDRFLSEYSRPRIKDLAKYRGLAKTAIRRALPLVGERRSNELTPEEIGKLRDALLGQYAANSVRVTLAHLAKVFAWAVKTRIIPHNPFKNVEMPLRRDAVEYLTLAETRALLATAEQRAEKGRLADKALHASVAFALYTGVRKGELAALRWRDLDLETGRLSILRSFDAAPKSNRPRHLRLPDAMIPILAAWAKECPKTSDGLVFPRPFRNGAWGMIKDSSDMVGLPELLQAASCPSPTRPWHALRHTFASHFVMSGGSLLALSKILGHADIKMTMIYAHLAPDFIGAEMNRVRF